MIIEIKKESKLSAIEENFSHNFPFLLLRFYQHDLHGKHKKKEDKYFSDLNTCVKDACNLKHDIFIELHYWQKTNTIEKIFRDKTGLHVHIFRKHGDHWIQTTGTDELTLEEQNNMGRKDSEEEIHGINHPVEIEKLL